MELTDKAKEILAQYARHVPFYLTVDCGFAAVPGEVKRDRKTPASSDPVLILGAVVSFNNAQAQVKVTDNGYNWMDEPCPIHALAGAASQVSPVLPLPEVYLLKPNQQLTLDFTNGTTSPETGGKFTFVALRLLNQ